MAKKIIKYDGHNLDSKEELEFYYWLEEAKRAGFVNQFIYHPVKWEITPKVTYPLSDRLKAKMKLIDKFLLANLTYEPDFAIQFTDKFFEKFGYDVLMRVRRGEYQGEERYYYTNDIYVDVKGTYSQNDAHRRFSVMQKLVFQKFGVYVNMVIPESCTQGKRYIPGFFEKTFVPLKAAFMSNRKVLTLRKPYINCRLIQGVL